MTCIYKEGLAILLPLAIQTKSGIQRHGVFVVQTPPAENYLGSVISTPGFQK